MTFYNIDRPRRYGFTLVELLIVVLILAILAAIAVPNLLEFQTRAKLSGARSDLRTLATGLEAYIIEFNDYPPHGERLPDGTVNFPATAAGLGTYEWAPPQGLTTPIAFLTVMPVDRFRDASLPYPDKAYGYIHSERMAGILERKGFLASSRGIVPSYGKWRLYSAGPDGDKGADTKQNLLYDPTNGTVSNGDLVRTQRETVLSQVTDEGS